MSPTLAMMNTGPLKQCLSYIHQKFMEDDDWVGLFWTNTAILLEAP